MISTTITVTDLREGDRFVDSGTGLPVWKAIADAELRGGGVTCDVFFFADGGCSTRAWNADQQITVERAL